MFVYITTLSAVPDNLVCNCISVEPNKLSLFIVLILVPLTNVSCFLANSVSV